MISILQAFFLLIGPASSLMFPAEMRQIIIIILFIITGELFSALNGRKKKKQCLFFLFTGNMGDSLHS